MKKICTECNIEKDIIEFSKKNIINGIQKYQSKCKCCINTYASKYRVINKDKIKDYDKNYWINNKEKKNEQKRKKYNSDETIRNKKFEYRESVKDKTKIYRLNNKEHLNKLQKNYRDNNKHVVIWRSILHRVIKQFNSVKNGHTIDILGYSAIELKLYLESLFQEGMSWNNYGEWVVDHIYPVSKFDKNTPVSIVNALSNLQPLWFEDNLKKSNKTSF